MRYLSIFCLLSFSFLVSCKSSSEDMILGEWVLDDIKYENLEQLCQNEVNFTLQSIENQLMMIDAETQNVDSKKDNQALLKKRQDLEDYKKTVSVDDFIKQYNQKAIDLKGKFTYNFDQNGKFVASYDDESKNGTWTYKNDTIFTTNEGQDADNLKITNLSSSELVISVETPNQVPLRMILTFKKK